MSKRNTLEPCDEEATPVCSWCGRQTLQMELWERWLPIVPGLLHPDRTQLCSLDCLYCHCMHWAPKMLVILQAIEERAKRPLRNVPRHQPPQPMEQQQQVHSTAQAAEADPDDPASFSDLLGAPDPD